MCHKKSESHSFIYVPVYFLRPVQLRLGDTFYEAHYGQSCHKGQTKWPASSAAFTKWYWQGQMRHAGSGSPRYSPLCVQIFRINGALLNWDWIHLTIQPTVNATAPSPHPPAHLFPLCSSVVTVHCLSLFLPSFSLSTSSLWTRALLHEQAAPRSFSEHLVFLC